MGFSSRSHVLAELAGSAAEFIAAYPEAAAFVARRLEQIFRTEASHAEEFQREEREHMRRRGFGG